MKRIWWRVAVVAGLVGTAVWVLPQGQSWAADRPLERTAETEVAVQRSTPTVGDEVPGRLAYWSEKGIRFEGNWETERIDMVISVLDRYAEALGEERFTEIIRQAVVAGTAGQGGDLEIAMDPSTDYWVASWTPQTGRIALAEGLFDQQHMNANYRWRFLDRLQDALPRPVTAQEFAVAHEIGHLLLDGLREEHRANGLAPTVLEDLYGETLLADYWADPFTGTNESLANEIPLWIFGIRRPAPVRAYLDTTLVPALMGEAE